MTVAESVSSMELFERMRVGVGFGGARFLCDVIVRSAVFCGSRGLTFFCIFYSLYTSDDNCLTRILRESTQRPLVT